MLKCDPFPNPIADVICELVSAAEGAPLPRGHPRRAPRRSGTRRRPSGASCLVRRGVPWRRRRTAWTPPGEEGTTSPPRRPTTPSRFVSKEFNSVLRATAFRFGTLTQPAGADIHRYSSACGRCFVCFGLGPCTLTGSKTKLTQHLPQADE